MSKDTKEAKSQQENPEEKPNEIKYEYIPDLIYKKFFTEMKTSTLIKILNYILNCGYDVNTKVYFQNTEKFVVTGGETKSSLRSDLIIDILDENGEVKDKILIEFQSTKDNSMGFRIFVYALNSSETTYKDGRYICELPQTLTIYTTLDKDISGFDEVEVELPKYKVEGLKFTKLENESTIVKFNAPYINILALVLDEMDKKLDDTDVDFFKILYLYRYKKKSDLLLKEDYKGAIKKAYEILNKYRKIAEEDTNSDDLEKNKDVSVLSYILSSILADITKITEEKKDNERISTKKKTKYNEVYNNMLNLQKSYGEEYIDKLIFKGKQEEKENNIKSSLKFLNEGQIMEVFKVSKSELDDIRKKYDLF